MIFLMLALFGLYLLPVVPVARRIEYARTRPRKLKTTPVRTVTRQLSGRHVYINDLIFTAGEVCNNCGGDRDTHKGGIYEILNTKQSDRYSACQRFEVWDQSRTDWPGVSVYSDTSSKIASSLAISFALWLPLVIREASRAAWIASGADPKNFAVAYHGVETLDDKIKRLETQAVSRDIEIARLEADNKIHSIAAMPESW